ncbi:MAG: DUF2993 domain-containing protein [Nocardioides sp.]
MKKLLVLATVLALLALGLDRGGALVAERVAGSTLQSSQGLREAPEVSIGGFPFLDQLASSRYERVEVMARDVPLGEGPAAMRLKRLDVVLIGASTSRDFSRIAAGRAQAEAVLSYAVLGSALGIDLSYDGPRELTASGSFTVLGQEIAPRLTVRPAVVGGALSLADFSLAVAEGAAATVLPALEEIFGAPVSFEGIPFDVALKEISVESDGLHLTLRGTDVSYEAS